MMIALWDVFLRSCVDQALSCFLFLSLSPPPRPRQVYQPALFLCDRTALAGAPLPPPCVFGKVAAAETLCHILRLRGFLKTVGPVCKNSPTRYIAEGSCQRGWSCSLKNVLNFTASDMYTCMSAHILRRESNAKRSVVVQTELQRFFSYEAVAVQLP